MVISMTSFETFGDMRSRLSYKIKLYTIFMASRQTFIVHNTDSCIISKITASLFYRDHFKRGRYYEKTSYSRLFIFY